MLITIVALVALAIVAGVLRQRRRHVVRAASNLPGIESESESATVIPYTSDTIEGVHDECFKLAFGVPRFDYLILGEHATVVERVNANLAAASPEQAYFPRRPRLLPKLLQALHNDETGRRELVQMIMEDPALAGGVVQRANTAYYRMSPAPVESVNRAVAVLGTQGLRTLVASLILQPVFRLSAGYFENFAAITWDHGQRVGFAAGCIAQRTRSGDPLVAQLLGLLTALSRIVLFRLTADQYRELPDVLPRGEVFIRLMQQHSAPLSRSIAASWELSEQSTAAIDEQIDHRSPAEMTPLARTLYFGELCGSLSLLTAHGRYSYEGAKALLLEQGLDAEVLQPAWKATQSLNQGT